MSDSQSDIDERRAGPRSTHVAWLGVSLFVLAAGFVLEVRPQGRVGPRLWSGFVLPELCWSKRLFDFACPGCGLTRSVIHLMHGEPRASVATNPGGVLIVAVLVAQIPLRIVALRRGRCGLLERPVLVHGALWSIFAVLLIQFAWHRWGAALF